MNSIAIRAQRLTKSYKLYEAPKYRLWDMLGFARQAASGIREHRALSDISFEILKGEKVAIIGRNGAGKSTLLKLVTKVIAPSSGSLDIRGETQALLSIGTGFHPEFTGRQNASAYLASLGFSGEKLHGMVGEAIAFAELDDFADQPIKTYSTGMGMRLMFAAATMIKPDLLVIDEVLGVGDAYFQQKSFQHIREICRTKQTTLLLVTHDIYNAAQLCDRMMWIDRGRLLIDADPETVLRAYEDSVREQEERRLRAKAMGLGRATKTKSPVSRILVDIQSANNQPPSSPLYLSRLSMLVGGVQVASAPFGEAAFEPSDHACLIQDGSNWGDPELWQGRLARPFRNHGSPFHKVTAAFDLPLRPGDEERISIRVEGWAQDVGDFHVRLHGDGFEFSLGRLPIAPAAWNDIHLERSGAPAAATPAGTKVGPAQGPVAAESDHAARTEPDASWPLPAPVPDLATIAGEAPAETLAAADTRTEDRQTFAIADAPMAEVSTIDALIADAPPPDHLAVDIAVAPDVEPAEQPIGQPTIRMISPSLNITGIYGTGDVELKGLRLLGGDDREHHVFAVGEPVTFAIDYRLRRPGLKERLHVVIAFKRDGVTDVMRLFLDDILFDAATRLEGTVSAHCERLPLGPGHYVITVLIARDGYYHVNQTQYFSMNPGVYCAHVGLSEMVVEGASQLYSGTGAVVDAKWSLS